MAVELFAPAAFNLMPEEERKKNLNGCGTRGLLGVMVPDTIYGLRITPACNIHDFMYLVGETLEDKKEADRVFLNNLLRLIEDAGGWDWLKWLRTRRAKKYYEAVKLFGGPAFWAGKNKPENAFKVQGD